MPLSSLKLSGAEAPAPRLEGAAKQSQHDEEKKTNRTICPSSAAWRGEREGPHSGRCGRVRWHSGASDTGGCRPPSPCPLHSRKRGSRGELYTESFNRLNRSYTPLSGVVSRFSTGRGRSSGTMVVEELGSDQGSDRRPSRLHRAPARFERRLSGRAILRPAQAEIGSLLAGARRAPPARSPWRALPALNSSPCGRAAPGAAADAVQNRVAWSAVRSDSSKPANLVGRRLFEPRSTASQFHGRPGKQQYPGRAQPKRNRQKRRREERCAELVYDRTWHIFPFPTGDLNAPSRRRSKPIKQHLAAIPICKSRYPQG